MSKGKTLREDGLCAYKKYGQIWSDKDTWFLDHHKTIDTSVAGDEGIVDDVPMSSSDTSIGFLDPAQAKD
jgi:hypothetical protein